MQHVVSLACLCIFLTSRSPPKYALSRLRTHLFTMSFKRTLWQLEERASPECVCEEPSVNVKRARKSFAVDHPILSSADELRPLFTSCENIPETQPSVLPLNDSSLTTHSQTPFTSEQYYQAVVLEKTASPCDDLCFYAKMNSLLRSLHYERLARSQLLDRSTDRCHRT